MALKGRKGHEDHVSVKPSILNSYSAGRMTLSHQVGGFSSALMKGRAYLFLGSELKHMLSGDCAKIR